MPQMLSKELYEVLGNRELTVCKELTKRYENATKTTFEDVMRFYEDNEPKGEYVLVISGKTFETKEREAREAWESLSVEEHMAHYVSSSSGSFSTQRRCSYGRVCIRMSTLYSFFRRYSKTSSCKTPTTPTMTSSIPAPIR